jgi:peptidylprolyl isomerase domain and WD repeat-containing protein 1
MALNVPHNIVISIDTKGVIEYWLGSGSFDVPCATNDAVTFKYKTDTDLYDLAKSKTSPSNLVISPKGDTFVVFSRFLLRYNFNYHNEI